MTNLQSLTIPGNIIGNLAALTNMTGLTNLIADNDDLTNANTLSVLANLQYLGLRGNVLTNLPSMQRLTRVYNLDVSYNSLPNIAALSPMTNINALQIGSNPLWDLSPLTNLLVLGFVDCGYCQISNLPSLVRLTNLYQMNIDNNHIASLAPVDAQTSLNYLDAGSNPLSDLNSIALLGHLANLQTILLYNIQAANVSFVSGFSNVTDLSLDVNGFGDLSPLAGLTNLQQFSAQGNAFISIEPLAGLTNLNTVWLDNNNVYDLSAVSNLSQLGFLSVDNNNVFSLDFLTNAPLPYLTGFNLQNNLLGSIDALTNLAALGGVITLDASVNNLDVSVGSETLNLINDLQSNHGWSINYLPQMQAPSVAAEPMSAAISLDGGAVFNVSASSSTPPDIYYQWYFNGAPLSDNADISGSMTSSLTVTNAQPAAIGEYFVVVSDDAGRIFGGAAQLSVTNLIYLTAPAFTPPNQFQFTVQSAPGAPVMVQASTDLVNWTTLTCITNVSGMDIYTNTSATATGQYYRLATP